jgi:serine/threonine protein kinase
MHSLLRSASKVYTSVFTSVLCLIHYQHSHNILIDDCRRAVIIDFGLSKTLDVFVTANSTSTHFEGGTHAWTAPEVLLNLTAFTEKSDVFSFGIVIWEVLHAAHALPSANSGEESSNIPWFGLPPGQLISQISRMVDSNAPIVCPTVEAVALTDDNVLKAQRWHEIMLQCLQTQPSLRTRFGEVGVESFYYFTK